MGIIFLNAEVVSCFCPMLACLCMMLKHTTTTKDNLMKLNRM